MLDAVRDDGEVEQRVAIKVAERRATPEALERFHLERQILAELEHPNIARFLGGGTTDTGQPYLVMERIDGRPLDEHADGLALPERLRLMLRVIPAVAHAHRHLILHLDLKPSNILVQADGTPKLLDFGIAKVLDGEESITRGARRPLTPGYASPEQRRGERLTTRSDLYSLGLVLHRVLVGETPVWDEETGEALPPSCRAGGPDVKALRGDLDAIVGKALRRRPEERYGTAQELAADLRRHLDARPVLARAASWRYRAGRFARRHWPALGLGAALLASAVTAAATVARQTHHLAQERDRSRLASEEAEGVATFLTGLLTRLDPSPAQISVPQLLDRGLSSLDGLDVPPPVRARLLHALGVTYRDWGRLDEAEKALRQSLAIRRRHPTDASSAASAEAPVAHILNSLGRVLRARADAEAAADLHRRAINLARQHHGEDHPAVADGYLGLGNALYDQLELRAARSVFERACRLRRRQFGDRHLLTASCLGNLAKASADLGRHDDAVRLSREAVEITEEVWPEGHPRTASALNLLAQALTESRRLEEAEPVLRRVLELRTTFLGRLHPQRLEAINNLGLVVGQLGHLTESERLLRETLELVIEQQGTDHLDTVKAAHNLGKALFMQGRLREAEPYFRQSLAISRRLQPDSDGLAYPLAGLAELLLADGRPAEALPLATEALERARRALGADHRVTRRCEAMVRRASTGHGRSTSRAGNRG